jgi:hypothetical protein
LGDRPQPVLPDPIRHFNSPGKFTEKSDLAEFVDFPDYTPTLRTSNRTDETGLVLVARRAARFLTG